MKVGYYIDAMTDIDADSVEEAAEVFADEYHQIDEESDLRFKLLVEDCGGVIHEVKMLTEYDPVFSVEGKTMVNPPKISGVAHE